MTELSFGELFGPTKEEKEEAAKLAAHEAMVKEAQRIEGEFPMGKIGQLVSWFSRKTLKPGDYQRVQIYGCPKHLNFAAGTFSVGIVNCSKLRLVRVAPPQYIQQAQSCSVCDELASETVELLFEVQNE